MQASSTHPLLILSEMDAACRKIIGKNKSPTQDKSNVWSGVGFRINNDELAIQSSHIDEIIDTNFQQNMSSMPGAKPWLLGLISVRGQPLPVIDLKQFLTNEPSKQSPNSRLVVIRNNNHISGLFLEHVFGLKQFPADIDNGNSNTFLDSIKPYIDEVFSDNGVNRGNLSISKLVNNKDFANAAR